MRDHTNPLKNIPYEAFSIFQTSHKDFHTCLADISRRYPTGRITYINNHNFVPLLQFKEEDQDRLDHLKIETLSELLGYITSNTSVILFLSIISPGLNQTIRGRCTSFVMFVRPRHEEGDPVWWLLLLWIEIYSLWMERQITFEVSIVGIKFWALLKSSSKSPYCCSPLKFKTQRIIHWRISTELYFREFFINTIFRNEESVLS